MATSVNLAALPEVSFATLSASEIESAVLTAYERQAGVTLQPGDPVRLFLESLAYLVSVQNQLIDLAGKQNLLAYARGAHLDHLGALMGVERIPAQTARVTVRFSLSETLAFAVPVPEGTRVATEDGSIVFATITSVEIPAGELCVDVVALCTTAGAQATGLVAGQISQLVDPLPYVVTVTNTVTSAEGADIEDDERLRERIRTAPETYTVAGSSGAYINQVLAVSSDIEAVSVTTPEPGVVDVRFVLEGGEMPDESMISMVEEALSADTVRPLTDHVLVSGPEPVKYSISGTWYLRTEDATLLSAITAAVTSAVEEYRLWQRGKPGRDINPTKLISLVQQAGAKRVELTAPVFTRLTAIQIAREENISLTFGGVEDD